MKMRKKIVTAMAMAMVLSSTASISHATNDFKIDTGNGGTGQAATQSAQTTAPTTSNTTPRSVSGDIEINGEFNKSITNFPTPDKDGRYLRVTMPIKMDYVYDVDTQQITAADGLIQNRSVYATSTSTAAKLEPQPVKMNFENIKLTSNSTANAGVEFVDKVNDKDKNNLQLPFQMTVEGPRANVIKSINLKTMESGGAASDVFEIQGNSDLKLKLGLISGEVVGNTELLNKSQTRVGHKLTLKFEYAGK